MQEEIRLSSGRVLTPNCGILGLQSRDHHWYMTEGYDNYSDEDPFWRVHDPDSNGLTQEERKEISEMMVERWQTWGRQR